MANIVIEDFLLYMISFYVIVSVLFSANIFGSFFPGQKYNTTTSSFEAVPANVSYAPSFFGDTTEINQTLAPFQNGSSLADPSALIDPLKLVSLVGAYLSLIASIIGGTILFYVLSPFIGAQWATIITTIVNIMFILVAIRVLSGRLRWS
jgi:hypothetical protein